MATVAILVPVRVANKVPAITESKANRPGRRPRNLSTALRSSDEIPEWKSISPINTNNVIGSSRKVLHVVYMLTISWSQPVTPPK
jgi:hypothetical protein